MIPGGPQLIVPRNYARPMVPSAIADAVAQWARGWGRSTRWQWVSYPGLRCWAVYLSPLPDDPKLEAVQTGGWAPEDADECVLLIDGGQAMDLEQYGPSGVINWFERNNMKSGRGEVDSLDEQVRRSRDQRAEIRTKQRAERHDNAKQRAKEWRRQIFKIPFLPVGINLRGDR